MTIRSNTTWVLLTLWLGLSLRSQAETATLNPVADTTLFETMPDNNLGADPTLVAGTTGHGLKSRALLKFDLAGQVPTNAVITGATLRLQVVKQADFGAKPSDFDLRRVLVPWAEGQQSGLTGSPAAPGEATWKARLAPDALWQQAGGAETNEYASLPSATVPVGGTGSYTFESTASLVADIQSWVGHPEANFGWMLLSRAETISQTARRWASREAIANAPQLQVDFSLTAAPLQITKLTLNQDRGSLAWLGGHPPFQIQIKHALAETNWADFGTAVQTNAFDFPVTSTAAYFRVQGSP